MIEAPRFVPARQDGIIIPIPSTPNYFPELPYYLRKDVLKKIRFEEGTVPEILWNERGEYIERRVQTIISTLPGVKEVIRNGHNSEEDLLGHDLTVIFEEGSSIPLCHIQVKSSRFGLVEFKQAIRDKYFPNEPNSVFLVKRWMTQNGVILINGTERKSDKEILDDSYYPQLKRILRKRLFDDLRQHRRKLKKLSVEELTPLFPV